MLRHSSSWSLQKSKAGSQEAFAEFVGYLTAEMNSLVREGESCVNQLRHLRSPLIALHGIVLPHGVAIFTAHQGLVDGLGGYLGLYNPKISCAEAQIHVLAKMLDGRNKALSQVVHAFVSARGMKMQAEWLQQQAGQLQQQASRSSLSGQPVATEAEMTGVTALIIGLKIFREEMLANGGATSNVLVLYQGDGL